MKYLIWASNTGKFRTKTKWVINANDLFEGEKMLSFDTRNEADNLIKKGFLNCQSYGINASHPLYKYC